MDLPRDLAESERRVEVLADGVLNQRFNFRVIQASLSKVSQSVFDQRPANSSASILGCNRDVGNVSNAGLAVHPG